MAKKRSADKSTKKGKRKKASSAVAELSTNELTIKFDHPHQILPKLLELASHFSEANAEFIAALPAAEDVLGAARARLIVSQCAQSTAWGATLGELGLNPLIFRNCVASGVDQAGYQPPNVPAGLDTRLVDVVIAIQGAPHK
jgi:hypothetical protein